MAHKKTEMKPMFLLISIVTLGSMIIAGCAGPKTGSFKGVAFQAAMEEIAGGLETLGEVSSNNKTLPFCLYLSKIDLNLEAGIVETKDGKISLALGAGDSLSATASVEEKGSNTLTIEFRNPFHELGAEGQRQLACVQETETQKKDGTTTTIRRMFFGSPEVEETQKKDGTIIKRMFFYKRPESNDAKKPESNDENG